MYQSENVILEPPLLINVQRKPKKKNTNFFMVYQILMIHPGEFNYVVISSTLNKSTAVNQLKDLHKRNIKSKIEVVNYKDVVVETIYD